MPVETFPALLLRPFPAPPHELGFLRVGGQPIARSFGGRPTTSHNTEPTSGSSSTITSQPSFERFRNWSSSVVMASAKQRTHNTNANNAMYSIAVLLAWHTEHAVRPSPSNNCCGAAARAVHG